MMDFKKGWGRNSLTFTLNILRFPSFQSPVVMPFGIREECAVELEKFLTHYEHSVYLHQMEVEHVKRLIEYLRKVSTPHEGASSIDKLEKDFKTFYEQYDVRRGKDFIETFPILEDWYRGI